MTAQTYYPEDFQREKVLKRLRATTARLWELQEADTDNLDPLVDLILGACAVEFERSAQDVQSSQARMLQRLANLMVPEVFTNARPAHAVISARPESAEIELKPEEQFLIEKEIQEGNSMMKVPVIFSPVQSCQLFDACVTSQAVGNTIIFYETPLTRGEKLVVPGQSALDPWSLWIGVRMNKRIADLKNLSIYFDWRHEDNNRKFLPLLPFSKCFINNTSVNVCSGVPHKINASLTEFDAMGEVEAHVLQVYRPHFLTIEESVKPVMQHYPPDFEKVFPPDHLKMLKEEACWIRIQVPEGITPNLLNDVSCSVNCVPVINRRLHASSRPYPLVRNLNIIPLQNTEQFLSVKRIYSQRREYAAVTMQGKRSSQDGGFAVRQGGVDRFDQRDAFTLLTYLHELFRDESAAFSAFGIQTLSGELRSLEQSLTRLELYFTQKGTQQPSRCHLLVNTREPEDVWIEYWSTLGEAGNKIPAGRKMNLISAANLKKDSILLMSGTSGGKAQMTDAEKLHAYKYTLLTRSRVVTEEDLRSACFALLGSKLRNVIIRKGIKKHNEARTGYVKTIDVLLVPAAGLEQIGWSDVCREMQAFLERRKSFMTSIRVLTQTDSDAYDS